MTLLPVEFPAIKEIATADCSGGGPKSRHLLKLVEGFRDVCNGRYHVGFLDVHRVYQGIPFSVHAHGKRLKLIVPVAGEYAVDPVSVHGACPTGRHARHHDGLSVYGLIFRAVRPVPNFVEIGQIR